jgi:putative membrane protein
VNSGISSGMTSATDALLARTSDRSFFVFNAVLSASAVSFLAYILLIRHGSAGPSAVGRTDLSFLPAVNATLNGIAASMLCAGYVAIRRRARRMHKFLMVGAFAASSLFLVCYVIYHYVHGDTRFAGTGPIRSVYFAVLISHVLLSISVVPLALTSFYFAAKRSFERHKRVTRYALPIWLYVSVTGVVIFFMLRASATPG